MTRLDARTERLYGDLTATERAVMVLQAWKRGEAEDPKVRSTTPRTQVADFNYLIAVMNAVNTRMGLYVVELAHAVELLVMELNWLHALDLWSQDVGTLGMFISAYGRTPITESDHLALVEAERARMAPVAELAEEMVEQYEGWTAADLERDEAGDEGVSDAAWERARARFERQLRSLVADGTLRGRRTKAGVVVEIGRFCDWRGEPPFVFPDWGPEYEVRPDSEGQSVERAQAWLENVRTILRTAPRAALSRRVEAGLKAEDEDVPFRTGEQAWERIAVFKAAAARQRWRELRAVELQFATVGRASFAGEDPELPQVRQAIGVARAKLEAVRGSLAGLGQAFEWEEPAEEELVAAREMYERAVEKES